VLANYAFDSTRQDCFRVRAATLYEDLVRAMVPDGAPPDPAAPGQLERIAALDHQPRPVAGPYYGDVRLDRILESYRRGLGDTSFLLPIGALRAAHALLEISRGRLLLLCGDKGVSREADLRGRGEPVMVRHRGCVSFSVNLRRRYTEEAAARCTRRAPAAHTGSAFLADDPRARWPKRARRSTTRPRLAPATSTHAGGRDVRANTAAAGVVLAVLKLSAFDAGFYSTARRWRPPPAPAGARRCGALAQVWTATRCRRTWPSSWRASRSRCRRRRTRCATAESRCGPGESAPTRELLEQRDAEKVAHDHGRAGRRHQQG
jgi:hypothetical protein